MSFEEAACVCESYITAFSNLFMIGGLKDKNTVIIHGGGGGARLMAVCVQLCKALVPETKIIVTSHLPSKLERVKGMGVDLVVDFTTTPDFSEAVKRATGKKGPDDLDHVGAKYLAPNMASLGCATPGHYRHYQWYQGRTESGSDDGQASADHR